MVTMIVAYLSGSRGIGKNGSIPWKSISEDKVHFLNHTIDRTVIMGSKTFFSLPEQYRPLPSRTNVVLTRSPSDARFDAYRNRATICDLSEGYRLVQNVAPSEVVVIGGEEIYKAFLSLCTNVWVTVIYSKEECDRHFPLLGDHFNIDRVEERQLSKEGVPFQILHMSRITDPELRTCSADKAYLRLAQEVLNKSEGRIREDRTGTGTYSIFGEQIRFDISKYAPLLTTKRVPWKSCIEELLWFMKGQTNANILKEKGVNIWNGNSSREFLDKVGLNRLEVGDCGANYSFQWRFFGQTYGSCHDSYVPYTEYDQLNNVLKMLRSNPTSRRIFMSSWNPIDLLNTVLPPCHVSAQFYVDENRLSCHVYQRSCDVFLGLPWNIFSYSVLTHILAKMTDLVPHELIMSFGDVHIYADHLEQLKLQMSRERLCPPVLKIRDQVRKKRFEEISIEDFELVEYNSHPSIRATMSV